MNAAEALTRLGSPPVGFTSLAAALMGGDLKSISFEGTEPRATLDQARGELQRVRDAQAAATSDAAWWGYQGQLSYWQAAVNILEAADLVGFDSLPDVMPGTAAQGGGVLMDQCAAQERYGSAVLMLARQRATLPPSAG